MPADAACRAQALAGAKPFISYEPRAVGQVDRFGAFDPEGVVDLHQIHRPDYFASAPYAEPVAQVEPRTTTVEFTAPRDSYERRHLGKQGTIKLRGWHLQGDGVAAADGPKRRALVIMNTGGGGSWSLTRHDTLYRTR